ncbi:MAG: ABC transporter permease [Chloroflexota bacterium]|jgi:putative ABC transport system permease protein
MRLSTIAINNLARRRGRAALVVIGLAVGVATVVSMLAVTAALRADTEQKIDQYGANILVLPRTDDLALSYGGVAVGASSAVHELTDADVAGIRSIKNAENISTVAPKLLSAVELEGARALLVGVDFPQELRLKRWWSLRGQEPSAPDQIILGHEAAGRLEASPRSRLNILGQQFTVAAVLDPVGNQEDGLIYADLATVQELLGKPGRVSLIEVSALCSTCPIEEIVAQIGEKLPQARVTALAQVMKSREQTVEQLANFSLAISGVVLLVGGLVVLTTMMSNVNERTREIGIFRAVGFRRSHVVRLILAEAVALSMLSGLLGWAVGTWGSSLVATQVARLEVPVSWDPLLAATSIALALLVGTLGSLYPVLRASSLDPAEALRSI